MKWFNADPSPEQVAVQQSVDQLQEARARRRTALQTLLRALDNVKLDDGLVKLGDELLKVEK